MKHGSSRRLFEYWNGIRGHRLAPERGEIEPGAIAPVLADSFIVAYDPLAAHPLRLAGTRLCALFCRELRGEALLRLWDDDSAARLGELMGSVADDAVAIVAGASARNRDGATAALELLLLPLAHRGRTHVRMLGVLAPIDPPYWLGATPADRLALGTVRYHETSRSRDTPLRGFGRRDQGQPRPHLTLHAGGRATDGDAAPNGERSAKT
ncbi:MAG: PAS domain-containing protein [Proteobacteria bacterium]|nr:PAS domain-containing protein [Pseudomonadota bacterium]